MVRDNPCQTPGCRRHGKKIVNGLCEPCTANKLKFKQYKKSEHVPVYPCGKCGEACDENVRSIICDSCNVWYHSACVDIEDSTYDLIMQSKFGQAAKWPCDKCTSRIDELFENSRSLQCAILKLTEANEELKDRLDRVEDKLSGKVKLELSGAVNERADIERRKLNVLVYNLPETTTDTSTAWDTPDEKGADIAAISTIIKEEMKIDLTTKITEVNRLGKKNNLPVGKNQHPRVLKIVFNDISTKRDVLNQSKVLASSKDTANRSIFINPDLTESQRNIGKGLREEMWKLREEGKNVAIRKGKIVTVSYPVRKTRAPQCTFKPFTPKITSNNIPKPETEDRDDNIKPTAPAIIAPVQTESTASANDTQTTNVTPSSSLLADITPLAINENDAPAKVEQRL